MTRVMLLGCLLILAPVSSPSAAISGGVIVFTSTRDGADAVYAIHPDGSHLTRVAASAGEAHVAPDGRHIALLTKSYAVRIVDSETLKQRSLPASVGFGWGVTEWPWSSDGSHLAVGSNDGIHVFDASGGGERVVSNGTDSAPAWSPDGKWIAFARSSGGLYVVPSAGGAERRLAADGDYPQWSPDGTEIVFQRYPVAFVVSAKGGPARRIGVGVATWAPDGKSLALATETSIELYTRGGARERTLVKARNVEEATWSPDGRFVLATIDRDLWLVAADGSGRRRLTQGARYGYVNSQASWSKGSVTIPGAPVTARAALSGPVLALRAADGAVVARFPRLSARGFDQDAAVVYDAVDDGRGGWFVGGDFLSAAGAPCRNLIHIDARLRVTRAWCPRPDGTVRALVRVGSTLYVAGDRFSRIAGAGRRNLAAFDVRTGRLLPWNPSAAGSVYEISADPRGTAVYVSGVFDRLGGARRANLGAVDARTGRALRFAPNPDANVHGDSVSAFVVTASRVYVWGSYSTIGGRAIRTFDAAVLDPATGRYIGALKMEGGPYATAVAGDRVFLGGVITSVAHRHRDDLVSLTGRTGLPDSWAPRTGAKLVVEDMALAGRIVIAALTHDHWSSGPRTIVAFDSVSGRRRWARPTRADIVNTVARSGRLVVVGGSFR